MSYAKLPLEVQKAILRGSSPSELASLCLVSKSFATVAQPLLDRSIAFRLVKDSRLEKTRRDQKEEAEDGSKEPWPLAYHRTREAMMKGFDRRPARKANVKKVDLSFDRDMVPQDIDVSRAEAIGDFLPSFSNLEEVSFTNHYLGRDFDAVLERIPPTVTTLDFKDANIASAQLLTFLRGLPLVRNLVIPFDLKNRFYSTNLPEGDLPKLEHLENLELFPPFSSQKLFEVFLEAPSLTTLSLDLASLIHLAPFPSTLEKITNLTLWGRAYEYDGEGESIDRRKYPKPFKALVQKCRRLEHFAIKSPMDDDYESKNVLGSLPPSIRTLTLDHKYFKLSYLAKFVASSKYPSLEKLAVSVDALRLKPKVDAQTGEGGGGGARVWILDEDGRTKLEKVCNKKGVALSWIDSHEWEEIPLGADW